MNSYALSAETAKTIKGTAPYIKLPSGFIIKNFDELLGIEIPDGNGGWIRVNGKDAYSSALGTGVTGKIINVPEGVKIGDIVSVVLADGNQNKINNQYYYDDDGDLLSESKSSHITATWSQSPNSRSPISPNHIFDDCNTYFLTIRPSSLSFAYILYSEYGDPEYTYYSDFDIQYGVKYRFSSAKKGLCYIKPKNIALSSADPQHDRSVFTENKGFIKSALDAKGYEFPQTAFVGASFSLVDSKIMNEWRCQVDSPHITLSGVDNCTVTYNSKPNTPITINMTHSSGQTTSYTIPVPKLWASFKKDFIPYKTDNDLTSVGVFPVASLCKDGTKTSVTTSAEAKMYLFTRAELANNIFANNEKYPEGTSPNFGDLGYTRGAEASFMAEWGSLDSYSDKYSKFDWTWTNEAYSNDRQFATHSNGRLLTVEADRMISANILCR